MVWSVGAPGGYHFDDAITPVSDPASQSLTAFVHHLPDTLRPATKLTYAVEASLGLDATPPARRLVTIAIHALAAALLCLLVAALAPALSPLACVALALLWSLHPVHAESVLAIAGRTEALSSCCVLGALLAHRRDRIWLAAVLLAVAGLARETAIAAIVPVVVLELTRAGDVRTHVRRLVPAAAAIALVAVWFVATPRVRELAAYSFGERPFGDSVARQLAAVPLGLSLYVRTWALTLDHGEALPAVLAIAGGLLYAGAATAIIAYRRSAPIALGAALWLAAIVPTQSLVPKLDALAERPLSLALAGIVIALAAAAVRWPRVVVRSAIPIVIALSVATILRGRTYRSDLLLWADAAAKSETNARPAMNHAYFLHQAGRDEEALQELERAHAIDPADVEITRLRDALRTKVNHAP